MIDGLILDPKRSYQKRQSIFVRLFASFVSSSLLIIFLIGFFYYYYASKATEKRLNEQVENYLLESVALFEAGYQSPIQSNLKLLESAPSLNNFLSFQQEPAALVRFDIEKQFAQLIRSRPELYRSIRFVDAFGTENVVVEERRRRRIYHSIISTSEGYVVEPQLKKVFEQLKTGTPRQLIFSQPFRSTDGRFLFYAGIAKFEPEISGFGGAVIIECDLTPYIELLSNIRTYGYPVAWLLTPRGKIITKPADNIPQRDPRTVVSTRSLKSVDNGIAKHNLLPEMSLNRQAFLTVVLSIPDDIFHSQNLNILKTTIFIALVAIVFTFMVAWMVSRKITCPVTELVRVSQQLANGDYSTRSMLHDNNEIGELSLSFNHMAEMLEQSMESLDRELCSRISAEQALQQSHESLQQILNSTGEGIFGLDTDGQFTFCNPSALQLLGYANEHELVGKNMHTTIQYQYADGMTYPQSQSAIIKTTQNDLAVHEDNEIFWRADQTYISVEYRAHPVKHDDKIVGAVISFSDISERKHQEKKIIQQAHYDMLTGLPNRFLALDRLEHLLHNSIRYGRSAAVLYIDLDGFKKVNDMLGHDVGDKLLMESAQRLKSRIRDEDTVGRLGGDEFIVLLGDLKNQLDAKSVSEKILQTFRNPFQIEDHILVLTASIGIAVYPSDSDRSAELLRNADIAMYEAKQSGRNTYHFFTEELNQGIQRRLKVEEQLYHALSRGEFYLVYQPILDIRTMNIAGAEVLLRWQNDKLGFVGPDEFIPITEQTGLITEIGDFILHDAIEQAARWQKKYNMAFKISVNVSPRQLHSQNIFEKIIFLLDKYQLDGQSLQLELTEGVLMSKDEMIMQILAQMKQSQIKISMDDFGTGYSSLSYLRKYPFDSLKIDRTFVDDIHNNKNDQALVNATLNMSHALGVEVVAEGIENNEQLKFLIHSGCEYGQGYLFSKPVTVEEFEAQFLEYER